jgi:hypothetical protein
MSGHTPGPWHREAGQLVASMGRNICDVMTGSAADARLIAAAPEMAQSLTNACDAIQQILDRWASGDLASAVNYAESAMHDAQETLAKAGL